MHAIRATGTVSFEAVVDGFGAIVERYFVENTFEIIIDLLDNAVLVVQVIALSGHNCVHLLERLETNGAHVLVKHQGVLVLLLREVRLNIELKPLQLLIHPL